MDKIDELLNRGTDMVYPTKAELEKVLRSGTKLTLYQGFDPTGIQMHIGHMIGLRKLAQFQKLGHHVIFLIGDGTGQAGDPSGKTRGREKFLTTEELRKNAVDYVKQAGKIVDFEGDNPVEIRFNGDWLNKLNLTDILNIAGNFTLQQLSERDMFQERMKKGEPVNLREFLYPLLQGYDSVAMKVDLEIGGTDQTFNMLCGRTLAQNMLGKNKFVLTTPLLADSSGRKIGKTEGNVIALNDTPEDLYGKIMSLGDDVIVSGFTLLTDVPMNEIKEIEEKLKKGEHPMTFKKKFAYEMVRQLHSEEAARTAESHFQATVQNKEVPEDIDELKISVMEWVNIVQFLVDNDLVPSKSEGKRLVEQGGVELAGQKVTDPQRQVQINTGDILRVGKRTIVKLVIN